MLVTPQLDSKLLDPCGPVVIPEKIDLLVPDDLEAQLVLEEINGRKGVISAAFSSVGSFSDEDAAGFSAQLTRSNISQISHKPKATCCCTFRVDVAKV
jgi:hypothetical protein